MGHNVPSISTSNMVNMKLLVLLLVLGLVHGQRPRGRGEQGKKQLADFFRNELEPKVLAASRSVGTRAPSAYQNCNCQCDSYSVTPDGSTTLETVKALMLMAYCSVTSRGMPYVRAEM